MYRGSNVFILGDHGVIRVRELCVQSSCIYIQQGLEFGLCIKYKAVEVLCMILSLHFKQTDLFNSASASLRLTYSILEDLPCLAIKSVEPPRTLDTTQLPSPIYPNSISQLDGDPMGYRTKSSPPQNITATSSVSNTASGISLILW
jgi:hypothetical protein